MSSTQAITATLILWAAGGKSHRVLEVPAGATIRDALQSCEITLSGGLAAVANDVTVDFSYILQPGDRVDLLPQISGG